MSNILKNKNCLVTGATGGIGKELVNMLVKNGCNVFLTSKSEKKLSTFVKQLKQKSTKKISYTATDLNNLKDIKKLLKKVKTTFGSVDILINSAGVFMMKSIKDSTIDNYDNSFNVNLRAAFLLSKEFSNDMIEKKWGRIINIGSSSSYAAFANTSLYCSSKHAILGLSRSLQIELKEHNIRVLCISPGSTKTELAKISTDQDFNTFLNPKEVAEFIIFAISFDAEMILDEIRLNRMTVK